MRQLYAKRWCIVEQQKILTLRHIALSVLLLETEPAGSGKMSQQCCYVPMKFKYLQIAVLLLKQ